VVAGGAWWLLRRRSRARAEALREETPSRV
jgi:hypothetical protein